MARRVGILGGSFDPPHAGHVGLCETVLKENWVETVWVIPCWKHPFNKSLAPYEDRFAMSRIAFQPFGSRAEVLSVERELGGTSYTLRTIRHLIFQYPDTAFYLILGQDAAQEAPSWHGYKDLKELGEWLIVPRGEYSPIPNVSGTAIREALGKGRKPEGLPKEVGDYIKEHRLYGT